MDHAPIPRASRPYTVVTLAVAVVLGVVVGAVVGILWHTVWPAIAIGAAVTALIAASVLLAARRGGRGTVEGAPPWSPDAQSGIRDAGPH